MELNTMFYFFVEHQILVSWLQIGSLSASVIEFGTSVTIMEPMKCGFGLVTPILPLVIIG